MQHCVCKEMWYIYQSVYFIIILGWQVSLQEKGNAHLPISKKMPKSIMHSYDRIKYATYIVPTTGRIQSPTKIRNRRN